MRLDLFFEEPLHSCGMLSRSAILQSVANLHRDFRRFSFAHFQKVAKRAAHWGRQIFFD
jgi:hypothetical protein